MGFSETIKVVVDVVGGQTSSLKGALSGLKSDIGDTEGAFGKLKSAGSGALGFISDNAAGLAAGAGGAIAAFAVGAIGDFQDLASSVGGLRDSLGLSASDASKWVEVAGDLGIGADKLQTEMGKMLKTAGSSPDVFKKLGVDIAYAKDGSVDANGTFLNVIDRLHGMKDPAERAAAAQKLLGKAWQDSAELINLGAEGVKARLDDVTGAKILSDDQIQQSRDFRDAMDDLGDRVDELKIKIAEGLLPALTGLADAVGPAADGIGKLYDAASALTDLPGIGPFFESFINPLGRIGDAVSAATHPMETLQDVWHGLFGGGGDPDPVIVKQMDALWSSVKNAIPSVDSLRAAIAAFQAKAKDNAQLYIDQAAGMARWRQSIADFDQTVGSSDFGKAALEGALTANHNYTAQMFALSDIASQSESAIDAFGESMKGADGKVSAATLTFDLNTEAGRKQHDALKGIAETIDTQLSAAYDNADGDMGRFKASAREISDTTLKRLQDEFGLSDQQVNGLRGSLGLTAKDWEARFKMSGTEEAREKVGLLQGSIDALPKDVQAKVTQAIVKGDYQGALNEIQGYYNRNPATVTVNARVSTASLNAVQMAAVNAGRGATGMTVPPGYAAGGTVVTAAEYGTELATSPGGTQFLLEPGTKITPRAESANMIRAAAGGGVVIAPGAITVHAGLGTNPRDLERVVMDALVAALRTTGPGPLKRALKIA